MKKFISIFMMLVIVLSMTACSEEMTLEEMAELNPDGILAGVLEEQEAQQSSTTTTTEDDTNKVSSTPKDFTDYMLDPTTFTEEDIASLQRIHDMSLSLRYETGADRGLANHWICVTGVDNTSYDADWILMYSSMEYTFNSEEEFNKAINATGPITVFGYYDPDIAGVNFCMYVDSELHEESFNDIPAPVQFADVADEFFNNEFAMATNYKGRELKISGVDIYDVSNLCVDVWIDESTFTYVSCFADEEELLKVNQNLPCTVTGTVDVSEFGGELILRDCTFEQ